ncbi:MAG: ferredoxin [Desulfuromonas sp.]|nr:MAG: ferredoxin [Desulfuromonas sp.]
MKIVVDKEKCQGSGECVKACPVDAIRLVDGKAVIDHERCDLDGICIPACPHGALDFSENS